VFEYKVPLLSVVAGVSRSHLIVPCVWSIVESWEAYNPAYQTRLEIEDARSKYLVYFRPLEFDEKAVELNYTSRMYAPGHWSCSSFKVACADTLSLTLAAMTPYVFCRWLENDKLAEVGPHRWYWHQVMMRYLNAPRLYSGATQFRPFSWT